MGMDITKFRVDKIENLNILVLEDSNKALEVLKDTRLNYNIDYVLDEDRLFKFINEIFHEKVYKLEDNVFLKLNENIENELKEIEQKIYSFNDEDKEYKQKAKEMQNKIMEMIPKQKDKLIENEIGIYYCLSDKEFKSFKTKEVVKLFYDYINNEIESYGKIFNWFDEDIRKDIEVCDITGCPKDAFEEMQKYRYNDGSVSLYTFNTKEANELLIECCRPQERDFVKKWIPLDRNEFILIN